MKYKITLNGKTYEVEVEAGKAMLLDEYEAIAPAAPAAPATAPVSAPAPAAGPMKGEPVAAPMPGTILSVNVKEGQTVREGDVVAILEAMKMENDIIAHRDGTVLQVLVSKGATVDTGAALITLG